MGLTKKEIAEQAINHCIRRAKERYSIILSKSDYNNLVSQVKQTNATFIQRESNSRQIWIVKYQNGKKNIRLPVIYDKNEKIILTILPRDYIKKPSQDYKLMLLQLTDSQDLKEVFEKVKKLIGRIDSLENKELIKNFKSNKLDQIRQIEEEAQFWLEGLDEE